MTSTRPSLSGPDELVELLGGRRGIVEATVPGVVFAVAYPLSGGDLTRSLWIAVGSGVAMFVVSLVQRRGVQQTISGLIGVGIMAAFAAWRGDPTAFYLPALFKNAAYAAAYLISALVRWPLIGLLLGPLLGEGLSWRHKPDRMRAYQLASLLWAGMFLLRLAVQIPLYVAGRTTALGLANIPLGLPLFLIVCGLTWVILKGTHPEPEPAPEPDTEPQPQPAAEPD